MSAREDHEGSNLGNSLRLDGHVIIVTGASSGIGAHFAKVLDAAGASLVLVARRRDLLEAVGEGLLSCVTVAADVTSARDRQLIVVTATKTFGRVDGLVNNAGQNVVVPALYEDLDDFRRVIEVNLIAPFSLSQEVVKVMRGQGGAIVNISSVAGQASFSFSPQASYIASKAGLNGLTRELATQWARYGVRVNGIAPSSFGTEMLSAEFLDSEVGRVLINSRPMRRAAHMDEINSLLLLLLHPSSSYITGQTIAIDGGLTLTAG